MSLPWDALAEKQLIGCCLLDTEVWLEALEEVDSDQFYTHFHKMLWIWAKGKVRDSLALDAGSIPREVCRDDADKAALLEAADAVSSPVNWRTYAQAIRDTHTRRALVLAGEGMSDLALQEPCNAQEVLEWAQRAVFAVSTASGKDEGKKWADLAAEAVHRMYRTDPEPEGITSGVTDLDQVTGGLKPGQLVIVGGRTGNGKTVLGAQFATQAAFRQGRRVLYVSLEMSGESITHRILSGLSGVSLRKFEYPQFASDADRDAIEKAANEFYASPLEIYDRARDVNVTKIVSLVRRRKAMGGLDLCVVDYLGLMDRGDVARKGVNTSYEFAEITRSLKILATEAALPVILLVQVSRGVDHREDPIPRLADLSDSAGVEKDADLVVFTVLHERYSSAPGDVGRASLAVRKNRGGRCLTIPARWVPHEWRFASQESPLSASDSTGGSPRETTASWPGLL